MRGKEWFNARRRTRTHTHAHTTLWVAFCGMQVLSLEVHGVVVLSMPMLPSRLLLLFCFSWLSATLPGWSSLLCQFNSDESRCQRVQNKSSLVPFKLFTLAVSRDLLCPLSVHPAAWTPCVCSVSGFCPAIKAVCTYFVRVCVKGCVRVKRSTLSVSTSTRCLCPCSQEV